MIYSELTKKAMRIAFDAHKEQTDKTGLPYIYHPIHLAEQMDDEASTCVALLHDVVEDSDISLADLKAAGFPEAVLAAIQLLTHHEDVPYMEYVAKIKGNPLAAKVKLADLKHNSDLTRLSHIDEKALRRREKYAAAIALLTEEGPACGGYVSPGEAHRYYQLSSGRVFRKNGRTKLFELLENRREWVVSGWAVSKFYDVASEYEEISEKELLRMYPDVRL